MTPVRTLIVVATYNELDNLPRLVAGIRQVAPITDLLVIDDNSPDGTGQWCDEQLVADTRFHTLHRSGKLGLGSAIITGLQYAIDQHYDWVVTMDADLSHDPKYLPAIFGAAHVETFPVDVVIGSRYVPTGGIEGWPLKRLVMSRLINWYARLMLRLRPRDCSGGYRCYRVEMLKKVNFAGIISQGYSLLEELLWHIQRQGGRIREVPITFVDRTHGKSKINTREALLAVWIIFRLGIRGRSAKY